MHAPRHAPKHTHRWLPLALALSTALGGITTSSSAQPQPAPPAASAPAPPAPQAAAADEIVRRSINQARAIKTAVGVWRVTEVVTADTSAAAESAQSAAFSFAISRPTKSLVIAGDIVTGAVVGSPASIWVRAARFQQFARKSLPASASTADAMDALKSAAQGRLEVPPLALAMLLPDTTSPTQVLGATRILSTRPERLGKLDGDWVVAELPWPTLAPTSGKAPSPPPATPLLGEFWFERVSGLLYAARVDMTAVYKAQGKPVTNAQLLCELDSLRVEADVTPATFAMPTVAGDKEVARLTLSAPPPPPGNPGAKP